MKNYNYAIYQVEVQPSTKNLNKVVQRKIEEYTSQGFEFYSQAYVPVAINPGCLSALLGAKTQYLKVPIFIFRKEAQ